MSLRVRFVIAFAACSLVVACSSQPTNPSAPSAVVQDGSSGLHTPNPCDHDTVAPTISRVTADPSRLWPPNHKWWTVRVSYTTADNCSAVTSSLSVTSDEPVDGLGDGHTSPDWEVVDSHTVRLRAERSGTGNGRVYTITVRAVDVAGNVATRKTKVRVAHDQGRERAELRTPAGRGCTRGCHGRPVRGTSGSK